MQMVILESHGSVCCSDTVEAEGEIIEEVASLRHLPAICGGAAPNVVAPYGLAWARWAIGGDAEAVFLNWDAEKHRQALAARK